MTNPILAVDDLTVLGGPTTVNVEVDFGPEGPRGSMIYTGLGNPNDNTPDGDVQLLDLYINSIIFCLSGELFINSAAK